MIVCVGVASGAPPLWGLTQPPVCRTRQMGDIKRSVPWQGSPSKLGRTVTGVMFWQGIKCLLHRRPAWHSARLMWRYRWLYNARPSGFCILPSWLARIYPTWLMISQQPCNQAIWALLKLPQRYTPHLFAFISVEICNLLLIVLWACLFF